MNVISFCMQAPSLRNGTSRPYFLVEYTGEGNLSKDPKCPQLGPGVAVSVLSWLLNFSKLNRIISSTVTLSLWFHSNAFQIVFVRTPSTTRTPALGCSRTTICSTVNLLMMRWVLDCYIACKLFSIFIGGVKICAPILIFMDALIQSWG